MCVVGNWEAYKLYKAFHKVDKHIPPFLSNNIVRIVWCAIGIAAFIVQEVTILN